MLNAVTMISFLSNLRVSLAIACIAAIQLCSGVDALPSGDGKATHRDTATASNQDSKMHIETSNWQLINRDYILSFRQLEAFAAPASDSGKYSVHISYLSYHTDGFKERILTSIIQYLKPSYL
jgi:hypothetical protein